MVEEKLAEWIDIIKGEACKSLHHEFDNFVIDLAKILREKDDRIRKLQKFVVDVRGVMGFGYNTMPDMIKDMEIYLRELEK